MKNKLVRVNETEDFNYSKNIQFPIIQSPSFNIDFFSSKTTYTEILGFDILNKMLCMCLTFVINVEKNSIFKKKFKKILKICIFLSSLFRYNFHHAMLTILLLFSCLLYFEAL